MSSANQSQIDRLRRELADLNKNDAREAKKEADLIGKLNRAQEALARTKSTSMRGSKLREVERAMTDLAAVRKKRADISGKLADKSKSLGSYENRQAKDDGRARKKLAEEQKRLIRERESHERGVRDLLSVHRVSVQSSLSLTPLPIDAHDFFISHASEDKDGFVRDLAKALQARGAKVWYDEFSLKVGDSLRRNIDAGLASSRLGVVVLSEHFFRKEWPNRELDGLVTREVQGETRILPIWHKVSKDDVARYSPTLADKVALNTSLKGIEEIADELMGLIR